MKHLNNSKQQAFQSPAFLLQDVYSIIDSRIQYIEYQAQCRMKSSINDNILFCSDTKQDNLHNHSDTITNNFDQMIQYVNGLSTPLKLLQVLKTWLREDNLPVIMTLLYNNTYLKYTEDHLEKLLKKDAVESLA